MHQRIEESVLNHFQYLPKVLGSQVQKTSKSIIIDSGFASSMVNMVCNANLEQWAKQEQDVDSLNQGYKDEGKKSIWNWLFPSFYGRALNSASYRYGEEYIQGYIEEMIQYFQGRPFSWWIGPSCNPNWLKSVLMTKGFLPKIGQAILVSDLIPQMNAPFPQTNLTIHQVENVHDLQNYLTVLTKGDEPARQCYENLDASLSIQEKLFVAYENSHPVAIANLYFENDIAGIFNVRVLQGNMEDEHQKEMIHFLIRQAQELNAKIVMLSLPQSKDPSYYTPLGFKIEGEFECLIWQGGKAI